MDEARYKAVANINFNEVIQQTVKQFANEIADLNRSQLESGVDSKNVKLPPYSASYARVRRKKGLPTDRRTLKFTGAFHDGFYTLAFMKFFEQGSKDKKAGFLEKRHEGIFGLTEQNLEKLLRQMGFIEALKTNYLNRVRSA